MLHCNRAAALHALGKYVEAVADCFVAAELDPGYMRVHQRRSDAYTAMGDYASAAQVRLCWGLAAVPGWFCDCTVRRQACVSVSVSLSLCQVCEGWSRLFCGGARLWLHACPDCPAAMVFAIEQLRLKTEAWPTQALPASCWLCSTSERWRQCATCADHSNGSSVTHELHHVARQHCRVHIRPGILLLRERMLLVSFIGGEDRW